MHLQRFYSNPIVKQTLIIYTLYVSMCVCVCVCVCVFVFKYSCMSTHIQWSKLLFSPKINLAALRGLKIAHYKFFLYYLLNIYDLDYMDFGIRKSK